MRAFHMSWFAFFLCFFAWFGIAPLMAVVRDELQLTPNQIGWAIIGSVSITIVGLRWTSETRAPLLWRSWAMSCALVPVPKTTARLPDQDAAAPNSAE